MALYVLLRALGVESGDQVAAQAFTCVAVPEAIMATGAHPVYIDVAPDWVNMDAADLARKITPRTRAIVVQHTFGIPADMAALMEIAEHHHIPVIEDCCHTLSSTYRGRRVGEFGIGAFYSFEWGKPLVAGLGGSLAVNDDSLLDKVEKLYRTFSDPDYLKVLKIQGQYLAFRLLYRPSCYWPLRRLFQQLSFWGLLEGSYHPIRNGQISAEFSLRMAGPVKKRVVRKLRGHHRVAEYARKVAQEYQSGITSSWVQRIKTGEDTEVVFARYPLLTKHKAHLLARAREANVELSDWYASPVHPLSDRELPLVGYEPGSCPQAESVAGRIVTLPTHPNVKPQDIARTIRFFQQQQP